MHYAASLIGKPWVAGARGPDAFDCWGLVTWVYQQRFGIHLPLFEGVDPKCVSGVGRLMAEGSQKDDWISLLSPEEGCVVAMSRNRIIHHVGIYCDVDGGLVLHALDGQNVVAQSLSQLSLYGWRTIQFYKHKDHDNTHN